MTRVAPVDAEGFRSHVGAAASVYGSAMRRSPEVVVQRREVIAMHLRYPGFVATVAVDDDDELVGFGYGYAGAGGQWWHDTVAHALGREATRRWLRDSFELAELHVLPEHQGQGLGRRLLDDIIGRTDRTRVVLSTPDVDSPARRLYRSTGFEDLLTGFYFPGSTEAYAVMGLDR